MSSTLTQGDAVNPMHYKKGSVEVIDVIREQLGESGFVAYCRGNVLKYAARAGMKNDHCEDLAKAAWYAQMAAHAGDPKYLDPRAKA